MARFQAVQRVNFGKSWPIAAHPLLDRKPEKRTPLSCPLMTLLRPSESPLFGILTCPE